MSRHQFIESLEIRRMLAIISATTANDTITISASGTTTHVVINGTDHTTTDALITVSGGDGNDSIHVNSTRSGGSMNVLGGIGNDMLVNDSVLDLDAVYLESFLFDGEAGNDTLVADNGQDSTTAANIDIHLQAIDKNASTQLVLYRNVEFLDYWDSNGGNRIGFTRQRDDNVTLSIHGNGGNDIITNTHSLAPDSGEWKSSMGTGGAFVDGGLGTDTLRLNDAAGGGGADFSVSSSAIVFHAPLSDPGPLSYSACESIDFVGSQGSDFFFLGSKPSGTSLRWDASAGNDTFGVGGLDIDASGFLLSNTTLLGGAGTDAVTFKDALDMAGGTDTYTFSPNVLAKGTSGFNYSGFESQILEAGDNAVPGEFTTPNTINLNGVATEILSTRIDGFANRSCKLTVSQGDLSTVSGAVTLNLGGGPFDAVTVNDQTSGGLANAYQVTTSPLRKTNTSKVINYFGVEQMTLNTSDVFDVVNVDTTPAGLSLTVNTNGGNDIINMGGGNVDANILGPVVVNGGSGSNTASIFNTDDMTHESQTLNGATFIDGFSHTFNSLDSLTIGEGPGGTNLAINSVAHKTNVGGGSGDDTFTVGGGDIDSNFLSGSPLALVINGQGGNDAVILNDLNDPNLNVYTMNAGSLDLSDGGVHWFVNWSNVEGITLDASNGTSTGSGSSATVVVDTAVPTRINGNSGNDLVIVNDATAPLFVHTGLGDKDALDINQDFDTVPVTVVVDQSDDIETLDVRAFGILRITSGATMVKTRAATSPGSISIVGTLDLAGGSFLSRAGGPAPATFRSQIIAGRNGGAWNGTSAAGAINSSVAASTALGDTVGYGLGSQIAPTTIGPFAISPGDTLLRYTLEGDSNLDAVVDVADLGALASNWQGTGKVYTQGDSNFDAVVDVADLGALASNWQLFIPSPLAPRISAAANRPFRIIDQIA